MFLHSGLWTWTLSEIPGLYLSPSLAQLPPHGHSEDQPDLECNTIIVMIGEANVVEERPETRLLHCYNNSAGNILSREH